MHSTSALDLIIGLTGVKENVGPTYHISLLPAAAGFTFSYFPRLLTRARHRRSFSAAHSTSPPPHCAGTMLRRHPRLASPAYSLSTARARPRRSDHTRPCGRLRNALPPPAHNTATRPLLACRRPRIAAARVACAPLAHSHHARQLLDVLSEPFLRRLMLALAHPQPRSHHYSPRWAARRGRARRSWSRSRSASGPVQRKRSRGPR